MQVFAQLQFFAAEFETRNGGVQSRRGILTTTSHNFDKIVNSLIRLFIFAELGDEAGYLVDKSVDFAIALLSL